MLTKIRSIPRQLTVYRFHPESHTARVLMGESFDFFSVRAEVVEAARYFDPERFDQLQKAAQSRAQISERVE